MNIVAWTVHYPSIYLVFYAMVFGVPAINAIPYIKPNHGCAYKKYCTTYP